MAAPTELDSQNKNRLLQTGRSYAAFREPHLRPLGKRADKRRLGSRQIYRNMFGAIHCEANVPAMRLVLADCARNTGSIFLKLGVCQRITIYNVRASF